MYATDGRRYVNTATRYQPSKNIDKQLDSLYPEIRQMRAQATNLVRIFPPLSLNSPKRSPIARAALGIVIS